MTAIQQTRCGGGTSYHTLVFLEQEKESLLLSRKQYYLKVRISMM